LSNISALAMFSTVPTNTNGTCPWNAGSTGCTDQFNICQRVHRLGVEL